MPRFVEVRPEAKALSVAHAPNQYRGSRARGTSPTVREGSTFLRRKMEPLLTRGLMAASLGLWNDRASALLTKGERMILAEHYLLDCVRHVFFFPQTDRTSMACSRLN